MEPKTLYEIYEEVLSWRIGNKYFRVRDVETNKDYLIFQQEKWRWDNTHMPMKVVGLLLEPNFSGIYSLDCNEKIYSLLSSQKEIEYFKSINDSTILDLIKINYMECL